ncbi:discoidin domain-containing protein [Embleya sp. NBC_00888]|uniref:discoidin domain-containing protein n=1 Tax=Embleya sp. NBC_00888 TaxID=2975960 RepID=UPI00386E6F6E|nr:discoidin domain-containing protein [Embleya sp. NBC_00888]
MHLSLPTRPHRGRSPARFGRRALSRIPRLPAVIAVVAMLATVLTFGETASAAEVLLSRGKPATASSTESSTYGAAKAVDGKTTTRWASQEGAGAQWLSVDLGSDVSISRVRLTWEDAYAKAYRIEVSPDGASWTKVYNTSTGDGGTDDLGALSTHGRHVRVYATTRATEYGYSLWEFEVFGAGGPDTTAPSTPTALRVTGTTSTGVSLGWTASTDNVGVTGYDVLRDGVTVGTSAGTSYADTGLTTGVGYTYTVRARDAAGNLSAPSASVVGTPQAGGSSFTVVAAGDISDPGCTSSQDCGAEQTAKRVEAINPDEVITLGDNQYDTGSLADFRKYYDTTWGRFKAKTRPSPGNHEYDDSPPESGYKAYFGDRATPNGTTWYSWDRGGWHFIALDSEQSMSANSAQIQWLKADLANNSHGCVAAYWHKPLYSSGPQADKVSQTAWQVLYDAHTDLILNGHDHLYERYAPQNPKAKADPAGIRELLVGTGGADPYDFESPQPNSEKRVTGSPAVLKLTLSAGTYSGQLVRYDGKQLDSFGPVGCH